MLFKPPVTGLFKLSFAFKISVSGPGQKASASVIAALFTFFAQWCTCDSSGICTINGWFVGRPFAANIFATASLLLASAARPYTVSVGKATHSPAFNNATAWLIRSSVFNN